MHDCVDTFEGDADHAGWATKAVDMYMLLEAWKKH